MKRGFAVASIAALAALVFAGGPGSTRVQARPATAEAPSTSPDDAEPSKTVPSSPAVNPQMTIMALATRASESIAAALE